MVRIFVDYGVYRSSLSFTTSMFIENLHLPEIHPVANNIIVLHFIVLYLILLLFF